MIEPGFAHRTSRDGVTSPWHVTGAPAWQPKHDSRMRQPESCSTSIPRLAASIRNCRRTRPDPAIRSSPMHSPVLRRREHGCDRASCESEALPGVRRGVLGADAPPLGQMSVTQGCLRAWPGHASSGHVTGQLGAGVGRRRCLRCNQPHSRVVPLRVDDPSCGLLPTRCARRRMAAYLVFDARRP